MKRASTSLPTPLSPVISTFAFPAAIKLARDRRSAIERLLPTRTGSRTQALSSPMFRAGAGNVETLSKARAPEAQARKCIHEVSMQTRQTRGRNPRLPRPPQGVDREKPGLAPHPFRNVIRHLRKLEAGVTALFPVGKTPQEAKWSSLGRLCSAE